MNSYRVALIPGDGIGVDVVNEGCKVLDSMGLKFDTQNYDLGANRYLKSGETLPDSVLAELKKFDAILLGAVGDPKVAPGILERGLLLRLRFELDHYVNLRPVKLFPGVTTPLAGKTPENIDMVVVREGTEGSYVGAGGVLRKGTKDELATEESLNTAFGAERVIRDAFKRAQNRRKHLTLVHKANVLVYAGDMWKRTFDRVAKEFSDVKTDYQHVDAASMFEPVHGSAPDIAGKGIADPTAAIMSVSMMLEHLGEKEAAKKIETAVAKDLATRGTTKRSTSEIGDAITKLVSA